MEINGKLFCELLEEITRKTGYKVGGCGCCGSPWLDIADLNSLEYRGVTYKGEYRHDSEGEGTIRWHSSFDQYLEAHFEEFRAEHDRVYKQEKKQQKEEGKSLKYGKMNTREFARHILLGEYDL